MRGDEQRIVEIFDGYLRADAWSRAREVEFRDIAATKGEQTLYVEAKGRTKDAGIDADIMFGQLLRRMPIVENPASRFIAAVPDSSLKAVLRVPTRVRKALRIDVYSVSDSGQVSSPHDGLR